MGIGYRGMSKYVRVKRKQQTIFLQIDDQNTITQLKKKIAYITQTDPENMQLRKSPFDKALEDAKQVGMQDIQNEEVLALVLRIADSEVFEEPEIPSMNIIPQPQ